MPTILIVPFTTNIGLSTWPGTVLVDPDGKNGLTTRLLALGVQLTVIDRRDVLHRLGTLALASVDAIVAALDRLTH